jgi:CDP-diglyceride synthetase
MTSTVQRILATVFGLLMAVSAGAQAHGMAFVAMVLAAVAVCAGSYYRPAATLAVLFSIAALALSDQSPLFAALSGLSAAGYLVLRHGGAAVVTATQPTMLAAVGFTFVGVIAALFPLQVAWLPLLAPLTVLGLYVLASRPFSDG